MPALVRLYVRHVLIGFVLGGLFTALLLWLNVANLWHLVTSTRGGSLAVLMLALFNSFVFSGVQFAIAVMGMAEEEERGGGSRAPRTDLQPQPVRTGKSGGNRSNRAGVNFPRA